MPNLIGYARVSRVDQHPEAQQSELTRHGAVRVFTDKASGASTARPELQECMEYLNSGDTLLIVRLDRLGRSVIHLKEILEDLHARNITLKATAQEIDTSTASGRMFVNMLAVLAEFERELLVERTKEGLQQARADGVKIGRPRAIDDDQAKMYAGMLSAGQSLSQIARTFGLQRTTLRRAIERVQTASTG
ncbi:recombinase family protein (plasmid) [Citricoccus nitrophenolicus]